MRRYLPPARPVWTPRRHYRVVHQVVIHVDARDSLDATVRATRALTRWWWPRRRIELVASLKNPVLHEECTRCRR